MKTVMVILWAFCFVLSGTAHATEAGSGEQIGIYVGAKIGGSIVNMNSRKFGQDAGSMVYAGDTFSWGNEAKGMGDKSGTAIGGGLNFGYDLNKRVGLPVRVELDYTIRDRAGKSNSIDTTWAVELNGTPIPGGMANSIDMKTSVKLQTIMFNGWFDIPTGTSFKPYVGGGIGVAFIDFKTSASEDGGAPITRSKDISNFAWSLGAGLGYEITSNWTVDLGYSYINAGEAKAYFSEEGGLLYSKVKRIETHDIMLGVRYTF